MLKTDSCCFDDHQGGF